MEKILRDTVSKNPVVIFTKSSCCMSHSIKSLFYELDAIPKVYELDKIPSGNEIERALIPLGHNPIVPAVFIGGDFAGGAKDIIALHVNGSLANRLYR